MLIAFALHKSAGMNITIIRNNQELTAYTTAVNNNKRKLVCFFFDMMLYHSLPNYVAVIIAYLTLISFYFAIYYVGFFYGIIYYLISWLLIWRNISQWTIVSQRGKSFYGLFLGCITCLCFSYYKFAFIYLSKNLNIAFISLMLLFLIISYKITITLPNTLETINDTELSQQILSLTLVDQPIEENQITTNYNIRLCTVCITNKKLATSHCKYCNKCIIGLDQHYYYLNMCIGKGNRRVFCIYLLFGLIINLFYFIINYYIQSTVVCPDAKGMVSLLMLLSIKLI